MLEESVSGARLPTGSGNDIEAISSEIREHMEAMTWHDVASGSRPSQWKTKDLLQGPVGTFEFGIDC